MIRGALRRRLKSFLQLKNLFDKLCTEYDSASWETLNAGQEERDESGAEGAGVDSMLGTLVISVACQLVALILSGIEHRAGVHVCFVRWL